ncbi:unnamed protein product [Ophioblennius macclurei]
MDVPSARKYSASSVSHRPKTQVGTRLHSSAFFLVLLLQALLEGSCSHRAGADPLRIVPSRLQLFQYDKVVFRCEGTGLGRRTVMRRVGDMETFCGSDRETSEGLCEISTAFIFNSGQYWCSAEGGERSDAVNITVTAGPLILDSPAVPVMVGEDVTLRCLTKAEGSDVVADFYRNGSLFETGLRGSVRIQKMSVNHSGFYKCVVTGYGESAESWLAVRERIPSDQGVFSWAIIWTMATPLLLVLGAVVYVSLKRRRLARRTAEAPSANALPESTIYEMVNGTTRVSQARPTAGAPTSFCHIYAEVGDDIAYSLIQVVEPQTSD